MNFLQQTQTCARLLLGHFSRPSSICKITVLHSGVHTCQKLLSKVFKEWPKCYRISILSDLYHGNISSANVDVTKILANSTTNLQTQNLHLMCPISIFVLEWCAGQTGNSIFIGHKRREKTSSIVQHPLHNFFIDEGEETARFRRLTRAFSHGKQSCCFDYLA